MQISNASEERLDRYLREGRGLLPSDNGAASRNTSRAGSYSAAAIEDSPERRSAADLRKDLQDAHELIRKLSGTERADGDETKSNA
jgi:hypothetical protein